MCWKLGSPVGWWGLFKRLGLMGDGRSSGHNLGRDWCCFPGIYWTLNMSCHKRGLGGTSSSLGSVASCFPVWSFLATCAPVIVIHACEALTRALAICCFAFESLTPLAWGPERWLSRWRRLLPSLMTWVGSLGPIWWREKTNFYKLSSDSTIFQ